jgi:hypothetical protein
MQEGESLYFRSWQTGSEVFRLCSRVQVLQDWVRKSCCGRLVVPAEFLSVGPAQLATCMSALTERR